MKPTGQKLWSNIYLRLYGHFELFQDLPRDVLSKLQNSTRVMSRQLTSKRASYGSMDLQQFNCPTLLLFWVFTLEFGIDIRQGITVGRGKFVKKNDHRALNKVMK